MTYVLIAPVTADGARLTAQTRRAVVTGIEVYDDAALLTLLLASGARGGDTFALWEIPEGTDADRWPERLSRHGTDRVVVLHRDRTVLLDADPARTVFDTNQGE